MPMIWKNKSGAGRVAATITTTLLMSKREKATVVRKRKVIRSLETEWEHKKGIISGSVYE